MAMAQEHRFRLYFQYGGDFIKFLLVTEQRKSHIKTLFNYTLGNTRGAGSQQDGEISTICLRSHWTTGLVSFWVGGS